MAKRLTCCFAINVLIVLVFFVTCFQSTVFAEETVWIATVHDTINPMVAEYLSDIISDGNSENVNAIIIELDTPGGLVESTRMIVRQQMNSKVPVITYVSPQGARAASAGMFITIASHVAVMAPATNIGAAHPVSMGPGGPLEDSKREESQDSNEGDRKEISFQTRNINENSIMEEKILNDMLAWSKTIAENRDRNVDWVLRSVSESISSTETEALKAGVIDLICMDRSDLLEQLDGRKIVIGDQTIILRTKNAKVVEKPMTWRQKFLSILINPTLAIYLLALGMLGLYVELSHPGYILPGVVGCICFIMGLFAMHTLPINYAGLLLILLAFIFFVLEVKVTSYGVLTIGGIAAFILGSSMLVDAEVSGMKVSLFSIIPLVFALALITTVLVALVVKTHRLKVTTGESGMIGENGVVTRTLNPEGHIFIHGEIWSARAYNGSEILENC
ncbi:nodulation protein NfeD [bacterium]|nr:nodulation protein NfeD [bacterium]